MARSERLSTLGAAALALGLGALAAGCRVDIPDGAVFSCATDADCGGDGMVCAPDGASGRCCLPGAEVCDGLDDDCDGLVDEDVLPTSCYGGPDGTAGVGICRSGQRACVAGVTTDVCEGEVLPRAEACNGQDDDCDGAADEGFDLSSDLANCGACGNACGGTSQCVAGTCVPSAEASCADGIDEDQDGATDCADPDCEGRACGDGCACGAGTRLETGCSGGADEDGDGVADCADADCLARSCAAAPATFTCDAQAACSCGGIVDPAPEAACLDGADEDCDGQTDCQDADCAGVSCGVGCQCESGVRRELLCDDFADNDGDGKVDCADTANCPNGTTCRFMAGPNIKTGTCQGTNCK